MTPQHKILQTVFGYPSFRPPQDQIIETVIDGGDALVIMPTGGGNLTLTVKTDGGAPLLGVPVYLFNDVGRYLGENQITDELGAVDFDPGQHPDIDALTAAADALMYAQKEARRRVASTG